MIITITGKSCCGKSFISNYLSSLDKDIIWLDIDKIGHEVLKIDSIKNTLLKEFSLIGQEIDRKELAKIVFNDQEKMKLLSKYTWPMMEIKIDDFIKKNYHKIIILDWILITKTKYFDIADFNILVECDFSIRKERAIKRDKISEEKFSERERAAIIYDKKKFEYIIYTNLENIKEKVEKIYDKSILPRKF